MSGQPPARLLIVDDDPRMRSMIKEILAGQKWELLEGSTGREAVALSRKYQPEWVIMDIDMPSMDGIAATRFIQSESAERRVLILSNHDSPQFRRAAIAAGAEACLLKDHLENLPEVLASLSQQPTQAPQSPSSP